MRNRHRDVLRNISVRRNSERNLTRSLNNALNGERLRNINISDEGNILLNNLRNRDLTLTLDSNIDGDRDLARNLNRNLYLLRNGNVNISRNLDRDRNSDLNGNRDIDGHVNRDRDVNRDLDRSGGPSDNHFDWVRNINTNFNRSRHGNTNRDIDGNVNKSNSVNVVRDFDANFSGDGHIDRDVDGVRNVNRDPNGHINGNGNLDRDLNGVRTSNLLSNLVRNWAVDPDGLRNILVDIVGLNDRNVAVLGVGGVLNLLNRDGVTADGDLNNLVLDERNITRDDLFDGERLRNMDIIRHGDRDIILERYGDLLVYISV